MKKIFSRDYSSESRLVRELSEGRDDEWLSEKIKDVRRLVRRAERWIAFRTYEKYHVIKISDIRGYSDSREMLLCANFAVLVHFVEVELAKMQLGRLRYEKLPSKGISKRELGLEYLSYWEKLEPEIYNDIDVNEKTRQFAKSVRELYVWWQDTRPNRKDPFMDQVRELYRNVEKDGRMPFKFVLLDETDQTGCFSLTDELTEDEEKLKKQLYQSSWDLEKSWDDEDQEMLHKLIDIRFFMWT